MAEGRVGANDVDGERVSIEAGATEKAATFVIQLVDGDRDRWGADAECLAIAVKRKPLICVPAQGSQRGRRKASPCEQAIAPLPSQFSVPTEFRRGAEHRGAEEEVAVHLADIDRPRIFGGQMRDRIGKIAGRKLQITGEQIHCSAGYDAECDVRSREQSSGACDGAVASRYDHPGCPVISGLLQAVRQCAGTGWDQRRLYAPVFEQRRQ